MDVVDADGMMISKTFTACNCTCANKKSETGDFECNICLDICKDPVVTLCGHLYCWPCLYQWLQVQFYSYECPVCNAIIEEEKLIPLYGRGKVNSNPRPQLCSDLHIPERPIGQRPPTAPPVQLPYFRQEEPAPTGFARLFAFLGVLSDIFRLPWNGMDDAVVYGGSTTRIPFMVPIPFNGVLVFGSIPFDAKNFFRDFSFLFLVILALLHIIY